MKELINEDILLTMVYEQKEDIVNLIAENARLMKSLNELKEENDRLRMQIKVMKWKVKRYGN